MWWSPLSFFLFFFLTDLRGGVAFFPFSFSLLFCSNLLGNNMTSMPNSRGVSSYFEAKGGEREFYALD